MRNPFKRRQPYQPLSKPVHDIGFKAVEAAIGPASVIKIEPFSLNTHINTIKGMLEAINSQIENAERQRTDEATLHETNERQEANRHVIVVERLRSRTAELEQLRDTYTAALKIAAPMPGGDDGYGQITVPPFEECAASGAGHLFHSLNPDCVTIICSYCGKEAPEQFQQMADDGTLPPLVMPPAIPTKSAVIKPRRVRKPAAVKQIDPSDI